MGAENRGREESREEPIFKALTSICEVSKPLISIELRPGMPAASWGVGKGEAGVDKKEGREQEEKRGKKK